MALVQDWAPAAISAGSTLTVSGSATTPGSFLHATISVTDATLAVTGLSDAAGNTWVQAPVAGVRLGETLLWHFYCFKAQSVSAVTATFASSGVSKQVFLREFDDDVGQIVAWSAFSSDSASLEITPAEVTVSDPGTIVIGSIVDTITNRTYTLQNTVDFAALNEAQNSGLETVNAYGILGAGTWGPEWHITTGTARIVGALTTAFGPETLRDKLVYDGVNWRNVSIERYNGTDWV